jgi:hypothetical protein
MNVRLILMLSLLGLLVAAVSIAGYLQSGLETVATAAVAIACSLVLARQAPGKFFLHGFLTGLIAGALMTLTQAAFMGAYLAHNPKALETFRALPANMSPAIFVVILTPISAGLTGCVTGLLTWLAAKFLRPKPAANPG